MKKINIEDILLKISLSLFVIIATMRSFIDSFFNTKFTIFVYLISLLLLIIICLKNRTLYIKSKGYPIVILLMLLPSLLNNFYLKDGKYSLFAYYSITCLYFILLSFIKFDNKKICYILNLFILFALLTSCVTWISIYNPSFYKENIITLFPTQNQSEILYNFVKFSNRSGLCTNYSRNAMFIVIGIICEIYYYIKNKHNSKNAFVILFLLVSLFSVGKRGHMIFLIISFIITFFIYNKVNIKTIFKFIIVFLVVLVISTFAIKMNNNIGYVFERLLSDSSKDISNGRFEMYNEIWQQFKNNSYMPLGWAKYASSTNYIHPGVHNDYLQLLCETGIIGFIIIIGLNLKLLFKSIKYANNKSEFSFLILIYNVFFLAYSTTGIPHYDIETYMFYFLVNYILYYKLAGMEKILHE